MIDIKEGDRVERIEDRDVVGATVTKVEGDSVLLTYDEGGGGWWPVECVRPIAVL